jgi:nucleoside-diphosphate-sugar epimerase
MKILITGATGYIGQRLSLRLAEKGQQIQALVRDTAKAKKLLDHDNITLFKGDIMDETSIQEAMNGCGQVYHLAALASVWHKNPDAFHQRNVVGLKNVLDCCLQLKIKNVLFTSTAGVAGNSTDQQPVAEYTNLNPKLETLYEKSKAKAEKLMQEYYKKGIRGIIVNPSRVYGPGLLTESNGFTRLLKLYLQGKWKIKPGNGQSIGNYAFIDDIVDGLMLAMEKAKPAERYLLGGENVSYNEFFNLVNQLTGNKRKLYPFPLPAMLFLSRVQLLVAKLFGKQPLITPPFVRKYNKDWIVTSAKAEKELGYTITPLKQGVAKTIDWLMQPEKNNL